MTAPRRSHVAQLAEAADSNPAQCPFESDRGNYTAPPMWLWIALLVVMGLALLSAPSRADAAQPWTHATATWYGPGFYGNAFACSAHPRVPDRYSRNVRGVAHMTLPCGSWLRVCRYRRCVRVRVIDRGAFHHRNLDLTARTAMDLCRCVRPYTMQIRYRGA